MATLTCPSCRETFTLSEVSSGEAVRCPKCRKQFTYADDKKQKLIIAGVIAGVLLLFVVLIWFLTGRGYSQREVHEKTQQMIEERARQAEELRKQSLSKQGAPNK